MTAPLHPEVLEAFAWDAPFLPDPEILAGNQDRAAIGVPLAATTRWPRGQRAAIALQLVAAGQFLIERGLFPLRRCLHGARVERTTVGPWVRLAALPQGTIESPVVQRRLRRWAGGIDLLLPHAVEGLLARLVPELAGALAAARQARPRWQVGPAWIEVLIGEGRGRPALEHPGGRGRALWARRFAIPAQGAFWLEDEAMARQLAGAAALAGGAAWPHIAAGAFEADEVARRIAQQAAGGAAGLLLTTLPAPGIPPLGLAPGASGIWVFAPQWQTGLAHGAAATEAGAASPAAAAAVLAQGAQRGFTESPQAPASADDRALLASPAARSALAWLRSAGVALAGADLERLDAVAAAALPELERLGLGACRRSGWVATHPGPGDSRRVGRIAAGGDPAAGATVLAGFRATGDAAGVVAWCDERLDRGEFWNDVIAVASGAATQGAAACAGAEAAVELGRFRDAERLLDGIGEAARDARWWAVRAIWAEASGRIASVGELLAKFDRRAVSARLGARCELAIAAAARRCGDTGGERAHLERALDLSGDLAIARSARLELAACAGRAALHQLARERGAVWSADERARWLHLVGMDAWLRDATLATGTAFRAALRRASGENLALIGVIHADLGLVYLHLDRAALAALHFSHAESLLDRCGSQQAVSLVRANRALLACDQLDWREARRLTLLTRSLDAGEQGKGYWTDELELTRADLARGEFAAVRAALPRLQEGIAVSGGTLLLLQALAALRAHLALAQGDAAAAAGLEAELDDDERVPIAAVLGGLRGEEPLPGVPPRWGLAISAWFLAEVVGGRGDDALRRIAAALDRTPREAAVGLARAVALLAQRGITLPESSMAVRDRACRVLEQAELDGWTAALVTGGIEIAPTLRALDDILSAGTDAWNERRFTELARVLRLASLALCRDGKVLVSLGDGGEPTVWSAGRIEIRTVPPPSAAVRAALDLLARRLDAACESQDHDEPAPGDLLGRSMAMLRVRADIERWGPLPMTVLILGEGGTGKELVARELHRASGRRGSFVALNCAGLPAALLEAELFGVMRGAFTGADRDRIGLVEAAEGGTLFLDEIGELPLELQGKLLRLVQEHEVRRVGATRSRIVDTRFLAATNRQIEAAVEAGLFRQDLYYRLAVAVITVPPLRDRSEDVDDLARHFVRVFAARFNRPGVHLAAAALTVLRAASWPGNVRELESTLMRAVAAASPGEALGPDRFPELAPTAQLPATPWSRAYGEFRRAYFEHLIEECGGNRSEAARRAGISRQTLLYNLRELGLGHGR